MVAVIPGRTYIWTGILLILCSYVHVDETLEAPEYETCQQLATFDVVCNYSSSIIVLSARPCSTENVYLTYFNKNFSLNVSTHIANFTSLPFGNNYILIVEKRSHGSVQGSRNKNIILKITIRRRSTVIQNLNVTFVMIKQNCYHPKNESRLTHQEKSESTSCDIVYQLGDFSRTCLVTGSNSKIPIGVYMTLIDFCTVPFSFTVISATNELFNVSRFTETKSDRVIPVSNGNRNYGLLLYVNIDRDDSTLYEVILRFQTSDKATYTLTNRKYESGVGMMCPLHNCTKDSSVQQICSQVWVDFQNVTYNSKVLVEYKPCSDKAISADIKISLIKNKRLPFTDPMTLTTYRENNLQKGIDDPTLHLGFFGYERQMGKEIYNNGYLLLDLGTVSLYASRDQSKGLVQLAVLRHLPHSNIVFPILRTEFSLTNEDLNQLCANKGVHHATQIGIIISAVGVAVFVMIVFFICIFKRRLRDETLFRSRKRENKEALPYQIQLDEEV